MGEESTGKSKKNFQFTAVLMEPFSVPRKFVKSTEKSLS